MKPNLFNNINEENYKDIINELSLEQLKELREDLDSILIDIAMIDDIKPIVSAIENDYREYLKDNEDTFITLKCHKCDYEAEASLWFYNKYEQIEQKPNNVCPKCGATLYIEQ